MGWLDAHSLLGKVPGVPGPPGDKDSSLPSPLPAKLTEQFTFNLAAYPQHGLDKHHNRGEETATP